MEEGVSMDNRKTIKGGLFRTFFLTALLCMLIPVILISTLSINSFSNSLSSTSRNNLLQLSIEKMNEVNLMIENQVNLTKSVSQSSYVQKALAQGDDPQRLIDYLGTINANSNGLYENFFITKMSAGFADCLGGATLHDVKGEPWYEQCVVKGEFLGNNISPVTGRPVYVISYGVYDEGKFIGGLNNSIDLAVMTGTITNSITDGVTKVLIIDSEGFVIASANSEQILQTNFNNENQSTKALMDQMKKSSSGLIDFDFDGVKNIGAYANLGTMYTLVYMPEEVYMSKIKSVIAGIIITTIICGSIAVLLIFVITLSITKPLSVVNASINEIASGSADLTKRIDISAKYEIRSLVDGFNQFSNKMQTIIKEIKDAQVELTKSGEELQNGTYDTESSIVEILENIQSVNERIMTQAQIVEGAADAITNITESLSTLESMISTQGESVNNASDEVEDMLKNIEEVNRLIADMASDFSELQSNIEVGTTKQNDVTELVHKIEAQSKTLQEANVVISGIASQTNLLAMNAAIEAAHAGTAGQGFSVVADEIRKLSETSTKQSKKISEQLKQIMASISNVVGASKDSHTSFIEISDKIANTDVAVKKIQSAMDKQTQGSKEISQALKDMNLNTNEVLASSGSIANGSKTILTEIKKLQDSSFEMKTSIEEMEIGAKKINETGEYLSDVTSKVKESIEKSTNQVEKFTV